MFDAYTIHVTKSHVVQPKAGAPTGLFSERIGVDEPVGIVWQVGKHSPVGKPPTADETVAWLLANGIGKTLTIKMPGHHYWSRRSEQSYAGAEFATYIIDDVKSLANGVSVKATLVAQFPVRP